VLVVADVDSELLGEQLEVLVVVAPLTAGPLRLDGNDLERSADADLSKSVQAGGEPMHSGASNIAPPPV
jgi:hypothetical protein